MSLRERKSEERGTPSGQGTREAILETAERLFAKHGVQGVSVRRVLAEANVNVALAHYHFGDRNGLIREVLRRRVEPLNEERMRLLDRVERDADGGPVRTEDVLRAFFAPVVAMLEERPDLARLLGQLHVTADPELRAYFLTLFAGVLRRFSEVIRPALPEALTGPQRVSRAHFVFGAMIHLLTNHADLALMARGRFHPPSGAALLDELVDFCAAGLSGPEPDAGRRPPGRTSS